MNRFIINSIKYILVLFIIFVFASCDKKDNIRLLKLKDDYFQYNQNIDLCFDVDSEGNIYYFYSDKDYYEREDGVRVATDVKAGINVIDTDGLLIKTYTLDPLTYLGKLAVDGDYIYYTEIKNNVSLMMLNTSTGETSQIYKFEGFEVIHEIDKIGEYIFFLGIDKSKINKEYELANEGDTYKYEGEVIGYIDINSGQAFELPVELPCCFSATPDNNVMIYAYDSEGGYHFTKYDIVQNTFSKKSYKNLGKITEFDIYNEKNDFVFKSDDISIFNLTASNIKADAGITEIMPEVISFRGGSIVCVGGYAYFRSGQVNKMQRIRIEKYIRSQKIIHMISSQFFVNDPFGCGYTIDRKQIDEESFALAVLSQDNNFDICLMDSRQDISANIRDKGAFYALNEVEGVCEYLDACFPYIKESALNDKGDIWMLPIAVDVPCLVYNEKLCSGLGMDFSASMEPEEFIDIILRLNNDDELKNKISISGYVIRENLFYHVENMLSFGKGSDVLFSYAYYYDFQMNHGERNEGFRAGEIPHLGDDKRNVATCVYLCVNPASMNLKEATKYICALCDYLMKHNNKIMIFSDRSLYPDNKFTDDIYDIYKNADIQFTLPGDIFLKDFHAYLQDEIDLETLIKEGQRKIDTYLNE